MHLIFRLDRPGVHGPIDDLDETIPATALFGVLGATTRPSTSPRRMVGNMIGRAEVKRRRIAAAEELSMLLGDTTACAIAKDGRSYPAGKFHEGRIAALGELLRRVDAESTEEQIRDAAAQLRADWEDRPMPGAGESREWQSYRAGGVQALGEFVVSDV